LVGLHNGLRQGLNGSAGRNAPLFSLFHRSENVELSTVPTGFSTEKGFCFLNLQLFCALFYEFFLFVAILPDVFHTPVENSGGKLIFALFCVCLSKVTNLLFLQKGA
jgi:hypothetical protein